ncbi:uncharacterized protein STAUR_2033 [Stigmatella aurantiaca DW4/3-1]|uniref:Uncharacterized protein n=1 Tax=Stigmatella aurantiaca (strain DW4/3-1) TaxID=378806 RepID=E3FYA0_STIAD|nr:uncharacterized protein STAUR_2033 [Stigmatella aurantiaca DW4/3-1]
MPPGNPGQGVSRFDAVLDGLHERCRNLPPRGLPPLPLLQVPPPLAGRQARGAESGFAIRAAARGGPLAPVRAPRG